MFISWIILSGENTFKKLNYNQKLKWLSMTQRRVNVREYVPRVKHHHRPSKNNIALFIIYRDPENQRVCRDLKQVVLKKKSKNKNHERTKHLPT